MTKVKKEKKINLTFAVHYHIPAIVNDDGVFFPSYFGKWIDQLALSFKKIVLVVHTEKK